MGANGDSSVDSLNLIDSMLDLSNATWMLLAASNLSAFLAKLAALGKVALGLGFVIFIHELGHFAAAKTFGVRCDKFYVGFDVPIRIGPIRFPRTLGKFKWGETEYGIGIIPLGGYVKMLGQDDDPRKAKEEAEKVRAGGGEAAPLDPRSFPAKPVWQRMIIISAGVVMNLISAVFLAAAAYFYGVPYMPAVVGNTNAGGPAWTAGLQSGDQILRVGSTGNEDPNMRYNDLIQSVVISGMKAKGEPVEVLVSRGDEKLTIKTYPSPKYRDDEKPLLGFTVERAAVIASDEFEPFSFLNAKELGLKAKDRIVSIDGEKLPSSEKFETVLAQELTNRITAKWKDSVKLGIVRPEDKEAGQSEQELEVTIPPVPIKTLGLGFEVKPVSAVRPGSAGEKAGFQKGDKILALDGEAVVDAFELPQMFASKAGKEVSISVQRGSEQLELKVMTPVSPTFDTVAESGSSELSLGGIGVAFEVSNKVSSVDPEFVPDGAIKVGDELKEFLWSRTAEQNKEALKLYSKKGLALWDKSREFNSFHNPAWLHTQVQKLPIASKFDLKILRDGKIVSASTTLNYSKKFFRTDDRDLEFAGVSRIHQTDDVLTALRLGAWETERRFFDVIEFLKLLVTGNVGVDNVAGPITLFSIATSEASQSTSRLLLFLTLLSANLAIINFLPIPALDGGHMLFLTAEAVRGKPVDEDLQIKLTMLGVLGLLALMAFVIFNDISMLL